MWTLHSFYSIWLPIFFVLVSIALFLFFNNKSDPFARWLKIAVIALAVPLLLLILIVISKLFDIGLNSDLIYAAHDDPREFFIALDRAQLPYEVVFYSAMIVQISLINLIDYAVEKILAWAYMLWFVGIYGTFVLGFVLLNVWLGNWPRT